MTRLVTTGFELSNSPLIESTNTYNTSIDTSNPRTGSRYLSFSSGGWIEWEFDDPTLDEIYIGAGVWMGGTIGLNWYDLISVYGDGGQEATLERNRTTRQSRIYAGGQTSSESAVEVIPNDGWCYVELHYKMHDTNGIFEYKVDGNLISQITGDTIANGSTYITKVWMGYGTIYLDIDDVIINDTNGSENNYWPGQPKIVLATVNGAGTNTDWTPSTGSNYQCVDEIPISTTDYVYTTTSGLLDTYHITDPISPTAIINNVIINTYGSMVAGSGIITPALYINGSPYYGDTINLTEANWNYQTVFKQNPDDSQDWEATDIDDLEIGQRSS